MFGLFKKKEKKEECNIYLDSSDTYKCYFHDSHIHVWGFNEWQNKHYEKHNRHVWASTLIDKKNCPRLEEKRLQLIKSLTKKEKRSLLARKRFEQWQRNCFEEAKQSNAKFRKIMESV